MHSLQHGAFARRIHAGSIVVQAMFPPVREGAAREEASGEAQEASSESPVASGADQDMTHPWRKRMRIEVDRKRAMDKSSPRPDRKRRVDDLQVREPIPSVERQDDVRVSGGAD